MHEAPRDQEIRLYLPGVGSTFDEKGRPVTVAHAECVGVWDAKRSCWIDQKTGATVYPSQWQAP